MDKEFVITEIKGKVEKITTPIINHFAVVGSIGFLSSPLFIRIRAKIPQTIEAIRKIIITKNRKKFSPSGVVYIG